MFAICRGLSQTHTHTHTQLTHSPACVCVCKHCALGSFGPGWERGAGGWLIVARPAATLRSLCAPVNGVSHFPFSILLAVAAPFTACTLVFFLIARIFAFCILHELNSALLLGEREVETGTGTGGQHVAVECADIWRQLLWH